MSEESKNAITIREWCDRYGFSRRTFYRHLAKGIMPKPVWWRGKLWITTKAEAAWRKGGMR